MIDYTCMYRHSFKDITPFHIKPSDEKDRVYTMRGNVKLRSMHITDVSDLIENGIWIKAEICVND